jgi:hypothetical protein
MPVSVDDRVAALNALERLRYYSEEFVSGLIRRLPVEPPEIAKAALTYITALSRVPNEQLTGFRQYLDSVLANRQLDRVLRDQAFEACYQLYGTDEAEKDASAA